MKKIRLTESQLHRVIYNTAKRLIKENPVPQQQQINQFPQNNQQRMSSQQLTNQIIQAKNNVAVANQNLTKAYQQWQSLFNDQSYQAYMNAYRYFQQQQQILNQLMSMRQY